MTVKLKPIAEQVMLVTGASSGIGLVTAKRAAAAGAKVMLVARNREALAQAVDEIAQAGGTAAFHAADVGKEDELRAAAEAARSRFGRIDSWVNDAGVAIYAKLLDTPMAEHEQLFRTNYFGVVNGCRIAVEYLREAGGALITVASIAADIPSPILGAYAASKHAVKAYVEALRMETGADGLPISITIIKPAGIDTPIAEHAANHGEGEGRVPPPLYAPELVADAILHAAQHPRRDITVGGAGRANVLLGQHFPWLLDLMAPLLMRGSFDRSRAKTPSDNLFASPDGGRAYSAGQSSRNVSLYTSAQLHPWVAAGLGAALAAGVMALTSSSKTRNRAKD